MESEIWNGNPGQEFETPVARPVGTKEKRTF